jgi:hypothetical protein
VYTPTPNPQTEFIRYEERAAWRAFLGWPDDCEEGFERFEHEPDDAGGIVVYSVTEGQYLAFVTCNLGPYWEEQRAYWLDYRASPAESRPLRMPELIQDDAPQLGLQDVETLTGAYPTYHPDTQTLTNLHAYRGFKDCGVYYKYHLEEENFVLDEARYRDCEDTTDNALSYEEWTLVYPLTNLGGQAALFNEVASLPSDLQGEITALESLPDGALRLLTTSGYSIFRDGGWKSYFLAASQRFIGVDDVGRLWFFPEESPATIFYWDSALADYGGSAFVHADAGWLAPSNPDELAGRGILTDAQGQVWLATSEGVRVYADGRWTIFTRDTLEMRPALDESLLPEFQLFHVAERQQIWVGECDWAEGPMGGGGVRWLEPSTFADGQVSWRGGLTNTGCVVTITTDAEGNVWLGMSNGMVRFYDQDARKWSDSLLPTSGEYRQGYPFSLLLDPSGSPWMLSSLCGAASCDMARGLYQFQEGTWREIIDPFSASGQLFLTDASPRLLFDGEGTLWVFLGGSAYRLENDRLQPAADLYVLTAAVDGMGQVWVVAQSAGQDVPALWNLMEGE